MRSDGGRRRQAGCDKHRGREPHPDEHSYNKSTGFGGQRIRAGDNFAKEFKPCPSFWLVPPASALVPPPADRSSSIPNSPHPGRAAVLPRTQPRSSSLLDLCRRRRKRLVNHRNLRGMNASHAFKPSAREFSAQRSQAAHVAHVAKNRIDRLHSHRLRRIHQTRCARTATRAPSAVFATPRSAV